MKNKSKKQLFGLMKPILSGMYYIMLSKTWDFAKGYGWHAIVDCYSKEKRYEKFGGIAGSGYGFSKTSKFEAVRMAIREREDPWY